MDAKDHRIAELEAEVHMLRERLAELERRLGLDSSNSSKPPSSDGLRKKPTPKTLRSKGKNPSGGQKGHKGHTLEQVEQADHLVIHTVDTCTSCQLPLTEAPVLKVITRQVFDIPAPQIIVTEHRAEVKRCSCGKCTTAAFPPAVRAPVQYGARVQALAVYLSHQQLIPEDRLQQVFEDLFDLPIATATLAKFNEDFAAQVAPLQEQVLTALKTAAVKGADETGLRVGGKTQWLHTLSSETATHYRVTCKRGDLLADLTGILVHDHWKPYFTLPNVQHALCNAHHLRELKALEDIEKEAWALRMGKLLRLLARAKDLPLDRVLRLYDNIVSAGLHFHSKQPKLGGRKRRIGHNLLLRLQRFKDATLRFLSTPGVPFTNNQSEQDIRMVKVKQKISGGFRTTHGAQIFCTIRGFLSTQRKQNRNLVQAILNPIPA